MTLRSRAARLAWAPVCALIRIVLHLHGGFLVDGRTHIPARGPVLYCPNHFTDLDPAAVAAALPRPARFVAKSELFDMRGIGMILRFFECISLKRNSADRAALREVVRTLEAGGDVVIFPEGGGNDHGVLQPLNPGAMLIALQSGAVVVPVAIHNAPSFLPYKAIRIRRSPVPLRIVFGPPLHLDDLKGRRDSIAVATQRLTEALATMLGQPIPDGKPVPRD